MSTQTIGTYVRGERWRDQVVDRLRRLIGNSTRPLVTSASVEPFTVRLIRNELLNLQESSKFRVVNVRRGIVWLTGTPACGDIILRCGSRFELGDQWPFVLQALQDSEIELSA